MTSIQSCQTVGFYNGRALPRRQVAVVKSGGLVGKAEILKPPPIGHFIEFLRRALFSKHGSATDPNCRQDDCPGPDPDAVFDHYWCFNNLGPIWVEVRIVGCARDYNMGGDEDVVADDYAAGPPHLDVISHR